MKNRIIIFLLGLVGLACFTTASHGEPQSSRPVPSMVTPTVTLAPGYGDLGYRPPAPGSYELPALQAAPDGEILRADGTSGHLYDLYGDKYVLLSFIYSTCSDVNGCPLATAVLARIKNRLNDFPDLAANLRLVSLSFDPAHDTPPVMQLYGNSFAHGAGDWVFVTTRSQETLAPILAGYNQVVDPEYNEKGEIVGAFSHMLRVFLIDKQKRIRNIYSVSFLHPDILINDVRTLLLDDGAERAPAADTGLRGDAVVQDGQRGPAVDLMAVLRRLPPGLPPVPVPADNPVTRDKVALGRKLFFDRRLSLNNTISCAMCHVPEQGFTSNARALAVGIEGRTVRRNAPTLYNTAYLRRLFHDGREYSLEHQVWTPLLANNMMGNRSFAVVINKIRRLPDYDGLFAAAFAGKGPGMETIGQALASYERVLVSGDSSFDRWYYGKDPRAIGAAAQRGFALFTGKAGCASCHQVGKDSALFTDSAMHNTGLGWYNAMAQPTPSTRVEVSPGVYLDVDTTIIDTVSGERPGDTGLYEVTQDPADRWRYRTPSLRNISLTAPYMHDGSMRTLREVVEFYNRGGYTNVALDALIKPLGLSPAEIDELVVFLESLTGHNVAALVADALAAPVGDVHDRDSGLAHDARTHDARTHDNRVPDNKAGL